MTKTILHIATSIDGFIADSNGNSDFSAMAQKADTTFDEFYASVGSVVMGRKTYDYLKDKTPDLFKDKQVYVITHYLRQKEDNITFIHEDIMGCVMNRRQGIFTRNRTARTGKHNRSSLRTRRCNRYYALVEGMLLG